MLCLVVGDDSVRLEVGSLEDGDGEEHVSELRWLGLGSLLCSD